MRLRHGVDAAGQAVIGHKGGVSGIHQQQAAAGQGMVYPALQLSPRHHGPRGVVGGAQDDEPRLRDLLRTGQKAVFSPAGQGVHTVSGGKGAVPVGGVDGIADPNRHSGGKQGKQPAQGVFAAGGNGDLIG